MESSKPLNPRYDDPGKGDAGAVPDLDARTVVAVFDDVSAAAAAATALRQRGVSDDDLSIVRRGEETPPPQSADETKSGTGTVAGASAGALIGGALGLAALAIPGFGPLLAAGPLAVALGGAVTGGAVGGLVGSFAGLGVPTDEAKAYEEALRSGSVILAVKTADEDAAKELESLLLVQGAQRATSYQPAL
ncbi:MAG TPA: hypothetical protein VH257_11275 [Chloroflexota bacterium]|nr:hypothetical protein [Chloroflexota bacterium]